MTSFSVPAIIVALDFSNETALWQLVEQLNPKDCRLKVGKELFTTYGSSLVKQLINRGFSIFLDLKYHDIPNTVAKACQVAADMGVWMVDVHASGGITMLEAAKKAVRNYPVLLVAITVLTSLNDHDLQQMGINETVPEHVRRLALLAQQAGLDGAVCSSQEAAMLRACCGDNFCLVTPGIRTADDAKNDQVRIVTPQQAMANGANYLVIGRPITQAEFPQQKIQKILLDIL